MGINGGSRRDAPRASGTFFSLYFFSYLTVIFFTDMTCHYQHPLRDQIGLETWKTGAAGEEDNNLNRDKWRLETRRVSSLRSF